MGRLRGAGNHRGRPRRKNCLQADRADHARKSRFRAQARGGKGTRRRRIAFIGRLIPDDLLELYRRPSNLYEVCEGTKRRLLMRMFTLLTSTAGAVLTML